MKKILSVIMLLVGLSALTVLMRDTSVSPTPLVTPPSTASVRIIAFGDSLTAGYGLPLVDSYPSQLEALLRSEGYDVSVINAGVSGETTAGNRERAAFIRSQDPDLVLLGIGGNDALRFLSVAEARANIQATLAALTAEPDPPKVILLAMQAPLNAGFAYKAEFDRMYEDLAQEFGVPLVPFIVRGVTFNPTYSQSDGIHLNREGYRLIVEEYIAPAVREILDEKE